MQRSVNPSRSSPNAPDWSLFVPAFEDGKVLRKKKLWNGKSGVVPNPANLSEMLDRGMLPEAVEDIAAQICKNAPINAIPGLLSCLSCNYWRNERNNIDIRMLQSLADTAHRSVCGYVFNQGDIVWTCRQCAKDPTCVQCDKCFRKSDHEGHEVYFHRASGGGSGCCDCGDEEAWSRMGNCLEHNHPSCDHASHKDPLESVPPELLRGMRAVVKGAVSVAVSYIVCTVRGFCPLESNPFIQEFSERSEPIVARLHNDDNHTYDDVIQALAAAGLAVQSEQITLKVDKEGEAVVATEPFAGLDRLRNIHQKLSLDAGLLFSLVPESVVAMEPRVAAIFGWIQSLGGMSDGLRRVFVEMLISDLDSAAHCFPVEHTSSPDASFATFEHREALNSAYSPAEAFALREQFPSVLLHLYSATRPLPHIPLVAPVYCTEAEATSKAPGSSPQLDLDLNEAGATKEPKPEYEADYKSRLQHPFDHCHRDSLSVMLLGTPYLPVSLKKCVNDLIMEYQHDLVFKASFSQQVTVLYPALNILFCRGVGTADNTIFHTTVQVYTANSVVTMMSSDGVGTPQRLLPEGSHPAMITSLLSATLLAVLLDTGCEPVRRGLTGAAVEAVPSGAFLLNHSIRTQRLSHLCRDIEYLTADFGFCTRLLCEDVDRGMLDIWVDICTMLQCLDSYTRKVDTHVEREDDHWQDAANLILELESVSSNFIARALLDQVFADQRASLAAASSAGSAPAYTAPIISPYDKAQFPLMRGKAVALFTQKALQSITAWAKALPTSAGTLSSVPKLLFLGEVVGPYYTVTQDVVFPISDLRGVASLPMSVHLPLHRLFAKLIHFGASGGVDLTPAFTAIKQLSTFDATLFVEHPLRCLVFAAQVAAGMWRRNGYTVLNLAYNYGRAPLSKTMRDMDILSVQLSAAALGSDAFIATLVSRFQVLNLVEAAKDPVSLDAHMSPTTWSQVPASLNILEYQPALLGELLKLLIITLTYTPTCLLDSADGSNEGWKRVLKREIVHQVLTGVQSAGQMQRVKVMVGSTRTISDAMLQIAIEETCVRRADEEDSAKILSLRPESYAFFDPEFPSLPNQAQSTACDRIREHMKNEQGGRSGEVTFAPLISAECLPIPHQNFASLRSVLFCPAMMRLLAVSLNPKALAVEGSRSSVLVILSRAVHLVTLQVACCGAVDAVSALDMPYFRDAFTAVPDGAANGAHSTQPVLTEGSASYLQSTVRRGSGRSLLAALADVWASGEIRDDILYHQGLGWVLQKIFLHSPDGRELLTSKGIVFGTTPSDSTTNPATPASSKTTTDEGDAAQSKQARQKAAQLRAIEETKKRAAAALAAFGDDMSDDEDETEGALKTGADGEEDVYAEESVPECIICREKKNSPVGYLCFLQPSSLLRNAHFASPDSPDLMNVFRVVAGTGVNVYSEPSDDATVLHLLPQGEHIHVENRDGRWMKLRAPHTGWCSLYCNTEDAPRIPGVDRPASLGKVVVNLHPVSDLQFAKHGGARLHASACGHTMHFGCWDMFYAANYARYENNLRSAELLAVDVDRGESLCPLCKSVTNTLVPFTARTPCRPGTEGNYFLPAQCPPYCAGVHTPASLDAAPEAGAAAGELSTEAFRLSSLQDKPFQQSVGTLHALFAHNLERGKLVSDGQFYDSCSQQGKLPWDIDNLSEAGVPRNLALLRTQHAMWSATAYTLLTATCNRIRERNVFAPTPGVPQPTAVPLQLHDTDMSLLRHLLSLVWRSPSWVRNYSDFICKPMRALISGQSLSEIKFDIIPQKLRAEVGTPAEQFFTKTSARVCDLQRSLLSMPYESVSTCMYPNAKLVGKVAKLATDRDVPEEEAWAVLRSPLLSQDLHVIAIAAAASAADLPAFFALNQILCVAKLAQTLLEPAVTGQVDYFKLNENQHTKSGASVRGRGGAKGDAKHAHSFELGKDGDRDSTPSKRSKPSEQSVAQADAMEISTPSVSVAPSVPSISPLDASVGGLTQLRDLICRAAGVPQSRAAPLGWNLLAIVLDSWIPFLEYAYHLQVLMKAISGIRTTEVGALMVPLSASANAVSSNLRHDANHQHLPQKFAHAAALLVALDLPSVDQLAAMPFFTGLMAQWGEHFHQVHSIIEGADRKTEEDGFTAAAPDGVSPWIPTPAVKSSSPASGLRKKWWGSDASEQHDGRAAAAAKDSESISALDSLMWNMLNAGAAGPNQGMGMRAARGVPQPQQEEVDEEQRMENAMEETDMPIAMLGEAMDDDSDQDSDGDGDDGDEGNPHAYAPHYLGYIPGYDEDEEEDGEDDFDDDENEEDEAEEGGDVEGEEGDHSFYSVEEHEHDHDHDHDGEDDDSIDEWAEQSDSDQFFGADADVIDGLRSHYDLGAREGNQEDGDLSGDEEEEVMPGATTSAPTTPATKRPALHWKLQGVYPINPTVDYPAPELNALASVEQERNSATANLLQLMPVRAPLQGSISGTHSVVGFNGARAKHIFPDLSHMSIGLRHLNQVFIPLPTIYTDLYQMTKFVGDGGDKKAVEEPAICLVCGRILNAGNKTASNMFENSAGECTLHARSCGAGLGVFFLVQQCQVLLVRGSRGTYSPSLYLDSSGEVNEQRGQNRPLFLSSKRYKKLEELYVTHQVGKEIVRKRASAETVIRMNWF